jgi:hypothetical protein
MALSEEKRFMIKENHFRDQREIFPWSKSHVFVFFNQICYFNRIEKCAIYNNEYNNKNQKPNPHSYIIIEYFNKNSTQFINYSCIYLCRRHSCKAKVFEIGCFIVWLCFPGLGSSSFSWLCCLLVLLRHAAADDVDAHLHRQLYIAESLVSSCFLYKTSVSRDTTTWKIQGDLRRFERRLFVRKLVANVEFLLDFFRKLHLCQLTFCYYWPALPTLAIRIFFSFFFSLSWPFVLVFLGYWSATLPIESTWKLRASKGRLI